LDDENVSKELKDQYDEIFDDTNTDLYTSGSYKNIFELALKGKLLILTGCDDAGYTLIWNLSSKLENNTVDFYSGHSAEGELIQHVNIIEYINSVETGKEYKLIDGYDFDNPEIKKGRGRSPSPLRSPPRGRRLTSSPPKIKREINLIIKEHLNILNILICRVGSLHEEYSIIFFSSFSKLENNITKCFNYGETELYLFVLVPDCPIKLKSTDDCDIIIYKENFSFKNMLIKLYNIYIKKNYYIKKIL